MKKIFNPFTMNLEIIPKKEKPVINPDEKVYYINAKRQTTGTLITSETECFAIIEELYWHEDWAKQIVTERPKNDCRKILRKWKYDQKTDKWLQVK